MRRGRIGLADIGVLALLTALAVGTAFLQNRHQPLALYDQNIRATIEAQIDAFRAQDDVAAFGFASPDDGGAIKGALTDSANDAAGRA